MALTWLREIAAKWDREERNKINRNWEDIEKNYAGVLKTSNDAAETAQKATTTANEAKTIAEGIDSKATQALDTANQADSKSDSAVNIATQKGDESISIATQKGNAAIDIANQANNTSNYVQSQLDNVIAEGDSSAEVVQARAGYVNLRDKLDTEFGQVNSQLAQVAYTVGEREPNEDDDTGRIQRAIDALPVGGVLTGANKNYVVKSLYLKSDMEFINFNLLSKAGDTPLQSPITIGANNDTSVRRNIKIRNVHIDGNRVNQTALNTSAENGGRHGFRLIGAIEDLLIEDCSANYCASDGIAIYSGLGMNSIMHTDRGIKTNILVINSKFNYNRRHGGSGDSVDHTKFVNCEFNNNGITVDENTEGGQGAIFLGGQYGNGFDLEEYNYLTYSGDIYFENCTFLNNAKAGVLCYLNEAIKQDNEDFVVRKNIEFINCKLNRGVNEYLFALEITPIATYANLGPAYKNITLTNCDLDGSPTLRAVDDVKIIGGSIKSYTTSQSLGNLDHSTNVLVSGVQRYGKKFGVTASSVDYGVTEKTLPNTFPNGLKSSDVFVIGVGQTVTFNLPETRAAILSLSNVSPARSALIAIGESATATKLAGWDQIEIQHKALTLADVTSGKLGVAFFGNVLYLVNNFGFSLAYSTTILGD